MGWFALKLFRYIHYFELIFAILTGFIALHLTGKFDFVRKLSSYDKAILAGGLVLSSSGLFFLPSIFFVFTRGIPDWPEILIPRGLIFILPGFIVSSIYSVANFIFATALIPAILLVFYEQIVAKMESLKLLCLTVPAGIGGNLLAKAFTGLIWITFHTDNLEAKQESLVGTGWLLGNAFLCLLITMAILRKEK